MCSMNLNHSLLFCDSWWNFLSYTSFLSVMFDCIIQSWISTIFSLVTSMALLNYCISHIPISMSIPGPSSAHISYLWVSVVSDEKPTFSWNFLFFCIQCHFPMNALKIFFVFGLQEFHWCTLRHLLTLTLGFAKIFINLFFTKFGKF